MTDRPYYALQMSYQGAEWVQHNLDATHARLAENPRSSRRARGIAKTMSPLGVAVAEVLGLVYKGVYHLSWTSLEHVPWDQPSYIDVSVPHGIANFDSDELSVLLAATHDMCMRVEICASGPRSLKLGFSQRQGREGSSFNRLPTLEEHTSKIRELYTVVAQGPWPPPPPPKPTPSPWDPPRQQLGCCVDRPYGTGCTQETCMHLPVVGQTCNDCAHVERCVAIFGQKREDTSCQFFPRRFLSRAMVNDTAGATS